MLIDRIDTRLLDDWELLLALHHHERPWDGLITTDSSMLNQGPELATLIQTRLTLVVVLELGHNQVKASGLLFAHLEGICKRTEPNTPQVWPLRAVSRPHQEPWEFLQRFAQHNNRSAEEVWRQYRLSAGALARNPLCRSGLRGQTAQRSAITSAIPPCGTPSGKVWLWATPAIWNAPSVTISGLISPLAAASMPCASCDVVPFAATTRPCWLHASKRA